MICKNCGTQLDDTMTFCPKCGTKVSSGTPNPETAKSYKNQHIAKILVFVIAILIVFLVAWWITPHSHNKLHIPTAIAQDKDSKESVTPVDNVNDAEESRAVSYSDESNDDIITTQDDTPKSSEDQPHNVPEDEPAAIVQNENSNDSEGLFDSFIDVEPDCAKAYSEVIASLQSKYGAGSYIENGEPVGLVVVREVDFDKDDTPELLCAFHNMASKQQTWTYESPYCDETSCGLCYEVWGWQDERAIRLVHAPLLASISVDEFEIQLVNHDTNVYLSQGCGDLLSAVRIIATVQNNQWTEVVHQYLHVDEQAAFDNAGNYNSNAPGLYWNLGEQITKDEYEAIFDEYYSDDYSKTQIIPVWYGEAQLSRTNRIIQSLSDYSRNY